jgi:hypothetical protein
MKREHMLAAAAAGFHLALFAWNLAFWGTEGMPPDRWALFELVAHAPTPQTHFLGNCCCAAAVAAAAVTVAAAAEEMAGTRETAASAVHCVQVMPLGCWVPFVAGL